MLLNSDPGNIRLVKYYSLSYLFIHSFTRLRLLIVKENCFLFCIYMSKIERREESVKSAYWLRRRRRRRQREMNAENTLSLSLSFSMFSYTSPIFLFFPPYSCLHIAYRRSSSSTICYYRDTLIFHATFFLGDCKEKTKKKDKSNLNTVVQVDLLLDVTSLKRGF